MPITELPLWIQVGITAILVLITAYYAWANRQMVKEMQKTREMQSMPHLFFMVKEFGDSKWFSVKNVGAGPAFNIELNYGEKVSRGSTTNKARIEYLGKEESRNYPSERINRFTSTSKLYVGYQFETLLGKRISGEEIALAGSRFFSGTESEFNETQTPFSMID